MRAVFPSHRRRAESRAQPFGVRSSMLEQNRMGVEAALFADDAQVPAGSVSSTLHSELKQQYNRAFDKEVVVGIGFQIVRIHQVDEAAETFTLDFDLSMRWRDPSLVDVKEPDWEKAWSPMVIFRNEISVEQLSRKIFVSDPSKGIVFCYLKYYATFYEILELDHFPFDRQILHIDISSFRPSNELRFVQFPDRHNKIFAMPISMWDVQTSADGAEHGLRSHAGEDDGPTRPGGSVRSSALRWTAPPTIVTPASELLASADGLLYPRARFEIKIERRCAWYLWNVLLVTWALVAVSAVVFAIEPTETADRMSVNLTLVLTVMAFKFTFSSDMPKKAYLTWMDKYLVAAFAILTAQSAEIAVASHLPPDSPLLVAIEKGFMFGVYGAWTLFHVFVALFSSRMYPTWADVVSSQRLQIVL